MKVRRIRGSGAQIAKRFRAASVWIGLVRPAAVHNLLPQRDLRVSDGPPAGLRSRAGTIRMGFQSADTRRVRHRRRAPGYQIVNIPQTQITSLLSAVSNGDAGAAERLWRAVYDELHGIAHARMAREGRRGDLQTTVLVQEAYLRLMGGAARGGDGADPQAAAAIPANRRHFFAAAANAMRQFLVDDARKRGRQKRGAGQRPAELSEEPATIDCDPAEILSLDEALTRLRALSERKAEIVQLRYFAGLSVDEAAEVLGISPRQVDKEWRFAKAWLHRELR